jgi:hypothetical protein
MTSLGLSTLGKCPACEGTHPPCAGVDCRCGRHFHFGRDFWVRTDKCIVCPSCAHALSPLDFDQHGAERNVVFDQPGFDIVREDNGLERLRVKR